MNETQTSPAEAPPPVDLRPHAVAYLANNLRTNGYEHHARTMEALASLRAAGEPVAWQFYQSGKWWNGDDRIKDHRKNTEEAGYAVRDLYAAPQDSVEPETMEEILRRERERAPVVLPKDPTLPEDSAKGADVALPPLPEALALQPGQLGHTDQTLDYFARAAVLADRQQRGGDVVNIEAAARKFAECMDYPWAEMPEQGRKHMREHAQAVVSAALAATKGESNG